MKIFRVAFVFVLLASIACKGPDYSGLKPELPGIPELPEVDNTTPEEPQGPKINYIKNGNLEEDIPLELVSEAVAGEWRCHFRADLLVLRTSVDVYGTVPGNVKLRERSA